MIDKLHGVFARWSPKRASEVVFPFAWDKMGHDGWLENSLVSEESEGLYFSSLVCWRRGLGQIRHLLM